MGMILKLNDAELEIALMDYAKKMGLHAESAQAVIVTDNANGKIPESFSVEATIYINENNEPDEEDSGK